MTNQRALGYLPLFILAIPGLLMAYSNGPIPKLTGGFGEQTCVLCHNSFPVNEGRVHGGVFHFEGVPRTYQSGVSYPLTIVIGQPGQSRWGFEASVRLFASGHQAGRLVPADDMSQVKEADAIQYLEHTLAGTRKDSMNGPVEFHFTWIAPDVSAGPVLFNAAGNAANGNDNNQGDYIYTAGAYSGVEGATEAPAMTETRTTEKPVERLNTANKLIDLPVPKQLKRGAMMFLIQHRFLGELNDSRPGNAFGIDEGANINLEFVYAATDRLSFGVQRARFAIAGPNFAPAIITWTGTFSIRDKESSFWKTALVAGVEGENNFERQYSPFLQWSNSWDFKRLRAFLVPTMIFNSRNDTDVQDSGLPANNPQNDYTFSLGVGGDIALNRRLSLSAEYVPRLAGYGGLGGYRPTVSAGFNIRTWRHVFSIIASTSRDFTPAHYGVNAAGPWALGFNIYRQIK